MRSYIENQAIQLKNNEFNVDQSSKITKHYRVTKAHYQDKILILLNMKPMYGYEIWMIFSGRTEVRLNTLYRWLFDLESRGLVKSHVQPNSIGPDRKVYRLTQIGYEYVISMLCDATLLVFEYYKRYQIFSAICFHGLLRFIDSDITENRIMYSNCHQLHDYDFIVLRHLSQRALGRTIDILSQDNKPLQTNFKSQLLEGHISEIPVAKCSYGEIWLNGAPPRQVFTAAIRECKRVLRKGGILRLILPLAFSDEHHEVSLERFLQNSLPYISANSENLKMQEILNIFKSVFGVIGVEHYGIPIIWAKKQAD